MDKLMLLNHKFQFVHFWTDVFREDYLARQQVNSDCESPGNMLHKNWFVLDPLEEFYYKSKNPGYQPPPPFRPDCVQALSAENQLHSLLKEFTTDPKKRSWYELTGNRFDMTKKIIDMVIVEGIKEKKEIILE